MRCVALTLTVGCDGLALPATHIGNDALCTYPPVLMQVSAKQTLGGVPLAACLYSSKRLPLSQASVCIDPPEELHTTLRQPFQLSSVTVPVQLRGMFRTDT